LIIPLCKKITSNNKSNKVHPFNHGAYHLSRVVPDRKSTVPWVIHILGQTLNQEGQAPRYNYQVYLTPKQLSTSLNEALVAKSNEAEQKLVDYLKMLFPNYGDQITHEHETLESLTAKRNLHPETLRNQAKNKTLNVLASIK
jgi:hypothetical protein